MRHSATFALLVAMLLVGLPAAAAGGDDRDDGEAYRQAPLVFGADLLPRVGTSSVAPDRRRLWSVNVAGLSGGIERGEFGVISNITRGEVRGVQTAGAFNWVTGPVSAAQFAGGFNLAGRTVDGVQFAGAFNAARGEVSGVQFAGGFNLASGTVEGAQLALGFNNARGSVSGVQAAPFNLATGHVHGIQIGLLNIAPTADAGYGLIGIYWEGFFQAELTAAENRLAMAGIRHGSGDFYRIYQLGTRPFGPADPPLAWGLGLGWRTDLSEDLVVSVDGVATTMVGGVDDWAFDELFYLLTARPNVSFQLLDNLAVFGGPTATLMVAGRGVDVEDYAVFPAGRLLSPDRGVQAAIWPGVTVGLRLF